MRELLQWLFARIVAEEHQCMPPDVWADGTAVEANGTLSSYTCPECGCVWPLRERHGAVPTQVRPT